FNYYNPITVRAAQGPLPFEMVPTPGAATTGFGPMWPIRPDTMRDLLIDMKHRYGDRLPPVVRSEEHTSELQSRFDLVCRLLLDKNKIKTTPSRHYHSH